MRNIIGEYDVLFLVETKSRITDRFNFVGYDTYTVNNYRQGKGGAGGVGILIRKSIRRRIIEIDQCKGAWDACSIRIECNKTPVNFICVYQRPGSSSENIK